MTLRELALAVVASYDHRLRDELCMLAFSQAVERLRIMLEAPVFALVPPSSGPDVVPLELQAMTHISKILGALPSDARFRAIIVVALALAPDIFSEREYAKLVERAKSQRPSNGPGNSGHGTEQV